ncbi:MAG TPA: hypothetical protein VFD58_06570 [Blastocatellia bacterium]|nr:hypothetical protein [Blastocatellia bacterium]
MNFWKLFWTVSLLIAGPSFAWITLVVTIKGFRDLRLMFRRLSQQSEEQSK